MWRDGRCAGVMGARWSRMVRDGAGGCAIGPEGVHGTGCDAWWGRMVLWCCVVSCGGWERHAPAFEPGITCGDQGGARHAISWTMMARTIARTTAPALAGLCPCWEHKKRTVQFAPDRPFTRMLLRGFQVTWALRRPSLAGLRGWWATPFRRHRRRADCGRHHVLSRTTVYSGT